MCVVKGLTLELRIGVYDDLKQKGILKMNNNSCYGTFKYDTQNRCSADCDKSIDGYCTSEDGGCGVLPPQEDERCIVCEEEARAVTDKERIIEFVKKIIPDDFRCGHISMTFAEDDSAFITIGNRE